MDQLITAATGTFLSLFPIADPFGAVPIFYSLTSNSTPRHRNNQARRVAINVVIVLTTSLIVGRLILDFFGISVGVLQIAGGLMLARTAWTMIAITNSPAPSETHRVEAQDDITLVPLAIPLISGPGAIGMMVGLAAKSSHFTSYAGSWLGILGLGLLLYLCLTLGAPLVRLLGRTGLRAFTQILGFFILAIAVQMVSEGALSLFSEFTLNAA